MNFFNFKSAAALRFNFNQIINFEEIDATQEDGKVSYCCCHYYIVLSVRRKMKGGKFSIRKRKNFTIINREIRIIRKICNALRSEISYA